MTEPSTESAEAVRAAAATIIRRLREAQTSAGAAMMNVSDDRARGDIAAALARLAGAEATAGAALDNPIIYQLADLNTASMAATEASAAIYTAEATGKASDAQATADIVAQTTTMRGEIQSFAHDLFTRRIFDPYLQFNSDEERQEYERRRREREEEVNAHLAQGTPEGNLHAAGTAAGQMLDDAAHGAANSPDFEHKWNELTAIRRKARKAMEAAGVPPKEVAAMERADLRHELERIGRPAAEIERILAQPDPYEAAKTQLSHHAGSLEHLGQRLDHTAPTPTVKAAEPSPQAGAREAPAVVADASAILAREAAAPSGHGLTGQQPAPARAPSSRLPT